MVAEVERTRACTRDDEWNTRHRDEVPLRRADRNFAELPAGSSASS
ncbi:hypothetical protein [Pseudonocardia sp. T1-2H]